MTFKSFLKNILIINLIFLLNLNLLSVETNTKPGTYQKNKARKERAKKRIVALKENNRELWEKIEEVKTLKKTVKENLAALEEWRSSVSRTHTSYQGIIQRKDKEKQSLEREIKICRIIISIPFITSVLTSIYKSYNPKSALNNL